MQCIYAIRLKQGVEANANIQRVLPSSIAVQATTEDVHNLRLIAFHPISRTDVSVYVVSTQSDHYRTLKVKLCREDIPDSPIHVSKISENNNQKTNNHNAGFLIHFPPLQSDNKRYFVQLESSLSQLSHKYKTVPVYFESNTSFKHVKLRFDAERKNDQGDINQSSVIALPFIIVVALAFFNREKLWSWLNNVTEKWSKHVPAASRTPVQTIPIIDPRADDIIVEQIMNINKRKIKVRKT